ncbi:MAG: GNAT family N-acetyltransferase [Candidatus Sericytochromatia bacterium]
MNIDKINRDKLIELEELFSISYGEKIDIKDELDYFDETNPNNWFYATDINNNLIGFIRSFPFGDNNSFQVEFYGKNLEIEKFLIEYFDNFETLNSKNKEIRFCLKKSQNELLKELNKLKYIDKVEEFIAYEYNNLIKSSKNENIANFVRLAKNEINEINQIREVFLEFQDFSIEKIRKFIDNKEIFVYEDNSFIKVVSLNSIYEKYVEIIEITVKDIFRKKGYAEKLLNGIISYYSDKIISLKVKSTNIPAIKLYEKTGFKINLNKTEVWITKFFK